MSNTNCMGYVLLSVVLVMSLLMAPSSVVAEGESLGMFNLAYNTKGLWAHAEYDSQSGSETDTAESASDDSMGGMSAKEFSQQSANPIGKFAYIFTQFATTFNDGDYNHGDDKIAGSITFQPIIPIPLYGEDENEWRIVSRPTINLFLDQPIPDGNPLDPDGGENDFTRDTGLSDLLIPLPLALPESIAGRWLLALGPSLSFPTATENAFGNDQYCVGATGVFGYIADDWMVGAYPQTYFGVATADNDDDEENARYGNMFYWFFYNLTDTWQIGCNPTIQWNDRAKSDNKWNIPIGLTAAKITKFGNTPVRIEFGVDYSVVHEEDFGEVARFKINIIPVVARPIMNSIFGK